MCFDLKTSIITFIVGSVSGIIGILLKQYILGTLIIIYSLIQLSEIFIWAGLENNNTTLNKIGTNIGKYTLPAHVLAVGLGFYIATGKNIILIVGLLFYIGVLLFSYLPNKSSNITKPDCGSNCNKYSGKLNWPWPHNWYMFGIIIILVLLVLYSNKISGSGLIVVAIFSISAIVSELMNSNDAFGSFWCWMSAALAPILVGVNALIK